MPPDVLLVGGPNGSGHWTRLLALGRALTEQNLSCAVVSPNPHPALADCPFPVLNALKRARVVIQDPPTGLVPDTLMVCLVDGPSTVFHADLIVHQHLHPPMVGKRASAQLLCGPAYACLRPVFTTLRQPVQPRPIERVAIACGTTGEGKRLADQLAEDLQTRHYTPVVVGGTYFGDAPTQMASCDAAITTASMSALEAMCLGLPLLWVALNAEQQRIGASLGTPYRDDLPWSWTHAQHAWTLVDGQGSYRVASAIRRSLSARA